MKRKKSVLVVTILAILVVFSGCGNTDDTVVASQTDMNVSDGIEDGLADMGITVETETEAEELDADAIYVTDMLTVGKINVYSENSEDSDIIGELEEGVTVSVLGMYHVSQFYQVQYNDTTIGYVRTVDLCDIHGEYEGADSTTAPEDTTVSGSTSSSENPLAGLPSLSPTPLTPEQQAIRDKYNAYQHDSSQDEEYVFGQGDYSDGNPNITVQ